MHLKLYKYDVSPVSRSVMMICEIHNVPAEFVDVDYISDEHLQEKFAKKNPLKTVPVLEEGELILHDSHAMLTYLTEKYGEDDSMYPKDLKKRALVDQKLYFDTLLFTRLRNITKPAIKSGVKKPSAKLVNELKEVYLYVEQFLSRTKYIAADHMTIADIAIVASISSIDALIPLDAKRYPNTDAWLKIMEKQPFYQKYNAPGTEELRSVLKSYVEL